MIKKSLNLQPITLRERLLRVSRMPALSLACALGSSGCASAPLVVRPIPVQLRPPPAELMEPEPPNLRQRLQQLYTPSQPTETAQRQS